MLRRQSSRWVLPLLAMLTLSTSCVRRAVDGFTQDRVVPQALMVGDLAKACGLGESLTHALVALPNAKNPPHRALIIGEATSALCFEELAWQAELDAERAKHNFGDLGEARTAEMRDARIRAHRAHTVAADRFWRAFGHLESQWGPAGDECPRIAEDDEFTYLLALVAGVNALFHDRKGGGEIGVPLDTILKVGRASECLDNETWWNAPQAMQAGAWGTIPGSGPADVDPWALLEQSAAAGEASGVRVARALAVLITANAALTDDVELGIKAHAASLKSTQTNPAWALLDEYARKVTLHESDLIWTQAKGYRTPDLGELPYDSSDIEAPPDPFGADDPFGESDPFGDPEAN